MARFRLYSGNKGFSKPPPRTGDTLSRAGGCAAAKKFSSPSSEPESRRISMTETSLLGAVDRAWYGETLICLVICLPLSTSVMVMYCPGTLYASTQRWWRKSTLGSRLRCARSSSPRSSATPTTRVRSLPSRLAALLAMTSPSTDSAAALGSVDVANTRETRAPPPVRRVARSFFGATRPPLKDLEDRPWRTAARRGAAEAHDVAITQVYLSRPCTAARSAASKCGPRRRKRV